MDDSWYIIRVVAELFKRPDNSNNNKLLGAGQQLGQLTNRGNLFWLNKMWTSCGGAKYGRESLFLELYSEVRSTAPCAQLSCILRRRLERIGDKKTRSLIVSQVKDGCSPLFLACKKGNVEIVDYLLNVCGADVEQKGEYEVQDDRSVHRVSPLWCAAVAGKVKVVECLVKYGADVNSVSDTGSTPVRSACYMTHLDVVEVLVANNADIQKPNFNGGTCLINSVQSEELCEFLLRNGAEVNAQDMQKKTALHYAIQEDRVESTKLLLRYGANPHLLSRLRDDALQIACLKGAKKIFDHLVDNVAYSPERVASAFELIGSTFLDEHHENQKALQHWRAACDLRQKFQITKTTCDSLNRPYYRNEVEFRNIEELEAISLDWDKMRIHSLLICERILGPTHKDMIFRLMFRGASYADSLQFQQCIDLWKYALELRIRRDSILYSDTCFTGQALVKLFFNLHVKYADERSIDADVNIDDILDTVELLVRDIPESVAKLNVFPVDKKQQESYNRILNIITHLLHLLTLVMKGKSVVDENEDESMMPQQNHHHLTSQQVLEIKRRIHYIVYVVDPRTTHGDSLLHLSCMRKNILKNQSLFEDASSTAVNFFPSQNVVELLVECGAKINALNHLASSPLHTASLACNFNQEIVSFLLDKGAHIDSRNYHLQRPLDLLKVQKDCKINPLQYTTLKCLAARVISTYNLPYKNEIPSMLEDFVEAHSLNVKRV